MEPYVGVQHCILVRRGSIIRPGNPGTDWWEMSDPQEQAHRLDGVSYRYWVPSETEFPKHAKPPWAVYLRATGWNAGPTRVLFRVHFRNLRNQWDHLFQREMENAIPFPDADEETHDVVLNLPYIRLGGIGLHAITVHFWYDGVRLDEEDGIREDSADEAPEWLTIPEVLFATPEWAFGAVEYFLIVRP